MFVAFSFIKISFCERLAVGTAESKLLLFTLQPRHGCSLREKGIGAAVSDCQPPAARP
jgi:hypothetical protein